MPEDCSEKTVNALMKDIIPFTNCNTHEPKSFTTVGLEPTKGFSGVDYAMLYSQMLTQAC